MNMRHIPLRSTRVRNRFEGRQRALGFTLIELMVVIVLVGTLLAVLGAKIIGNKQRGEWKIAQTQLSTLSQKVESYQSDVGSLPDSLDQLVTAPGNASGWLGPYAGQGIQGSLAAHHRISSSRRQQRAVPVDQFRRRRQARRRGCRQGYCRAVSAGEYAHRLQPLTIICTRQ